MNGILCSRTKSGFLALAVAATLLLGLMWSVPGAHAAGAAGCSTQVDRAEGALAGGRALARAQMANLQRCVLGQPAQTADSLTFGQSESVPTRSAATAATVLASFQTSLLPCVAFNSDGTMDGGPSYGSVVAGSYLGTPGAFTLFSFTLLVSEGGLRVAFVGLSIGPFFAAVPTVQFPTFPLLLGLQVPNC